MCGVIGIFESGTSRSRTPLARRLADGVAALHHRGPDGAAERILADGRVGLGHARLSIIDVEGGAQPLHTADGAIWAIVNGEFYDFEAIRAELVERGHVFSTRSDSEILLHLYREHGIDCLSHLRGEFAFVLYDVANDRVFAARDRFGVKPLFVCEHEGARIFASEAKAILAAGVPARWDRTSYLSRDFAVGRGTLFEGVTSVAPGHYVVVDRSGMRAAPYWDLDFRRESGPSVAPDAASTTREVHDRLRASIAKRLVADVPIAFYLSGGLDSSAVLGIAADLERRPLPAFNLSFVDDPSFDERPEAELMAAHAGALFHPIAVTSDRLVDEFSRALWHNEGPIANGQGIAKLILSEAVRAAGYKVVLTGEGADETFAGYPHFRKDLLAQPPSGRAVTWIDNEKGHASTLRGLLLPAAAAEPDVLGGLVARWEEGGHLEDRNPVHVSMYTWAKSRLPNFVLTTLGDRMEMANGIEGRVPFLDHDLAELAARLPVDSKIQGRTQKHVLREAVRRYVPESIQQRKKHYFEAPPALGRPSSALYRFLQDTLRSDLCAAQPFYDPIKVRAALDDLSSKPIFELRKLESTMMEIASVCLLGSAFHLGGG